MDWMAAQFCMQLHYWLLPLYRAVNNGLLDTYQLKSLDGVLEGSIEEMQIVKEGESLRLDFIPNESFASIDNFAMRDPYDRVIGCLGFQFDDSLFNRY